MDDFAWKDVAKHLFGGGVKIGCLQNKQYMHKIEKIDKLYKDYMKLSSETRNILFANIEHVYHYTNFDSFKNIVQLQNDRNGLWLSNARFLNDAEEIKDGKETMFNVVKTFVDKSLNIDIKEIEERIEKCNDEYYICSFSGTSDSLDQWKSYSKNGNGVCIEMCMNGGNDYFSKLHYNGQGLVLKKVMYKQSVKNEFVNSFKKFLDGNKELFSDLVGDIEGYPRKGKGISEMVGTTAGLLFPILGAVIGAGISTHYAKSLLEKNKQAKEIADILQAIGINRSKDDQIEVLVKSLSFYYPFFKNENFKSEDEIRLVFYDNKIDSTFRNIMHFRVLTNNMIVPYIRTQDLLSDEKSKLPISRIIIGPTANQEGLKNSIRFFLDNNGYSNVDISLSEVPYRG